MKLSFIPYQLEFRHPFGVSSNTRTHTPVVFVKLESKDSAGFGEACLPAYLGESSGSTMAFLEKAQTLLKKFEDPFSFEEILLTIDAIAEGNNAAKAAIDIALFDLAGKLQGKPYHELIGIPESEPRETSCTIGIGSEEETRIKIREAKDFHFLKIKAGTADDMVLIRLVRQYSAQPLYVDVNQGWRDKHKALELLHFFREQNVVFVEQPMPMEMKEEMAWLTQHSPLPTIADESMKRLSDLDEIADCFSGINIKLMKCTGTHEARKIIEAAKKKNKKIMLGCMAESSCATSAMAQLMQYGDYIDLDAPLLLKNDPFEGVSYESGKVSAGSGFGFGSRCLVSFSS